MAARDGGETNSNASTFSTPRACYTSYMVTSEQEARGESTASVFWCNGWVGDWQSMRAWCARDRPRSKTTCACAYVSRRQHGALADGATSRQLYSGGACVMGVRSCALAKRSCPGGVLEETARVRCFAAKPSRYARSQSEPSRCGRRRRRVHVREQAGAPPSEPRGCVAAP